MPEFVDIAVVGGGAAGLMAAITAGRAARSPGTPRRIVTLDGARKLGAKILVSGGGRCNVTHDVVDESAFAGSSPSAIRKVLQRFDVRETIRFFRELGVKLKREETGKLFPVTDDAHLVLNALLTAAHDAGIELRHPARVDQIVPAPGPPAHGNAGETPVPRSFLLTGDFGELTARRVILATGGKSLPKTGSDGRGYELARRLGHTITPLVLPALVPLILEESCFIRRLSGLTLPATLELRSASGKRLLSLTDSTLCTHFGLSGPSVLDMSRYYLHAVAEDPDAGLLINWLPGETRESLDAALIGLARRGGSTSIGRFLGERLPQRLVACLGERVGVAASLAANALTKTQRHALASIVTAMPLPVTGDRGFNYAEVTAGGVPLKEIRLETMESRIMPGLYLCGEICDVDGRIGGYNFQWAWASGYVAGLAAASPLSEPRP